MAQNQRQVDETGAMQLDAERMSRRESAAAIFGPQGDGVDAGIRPLVGRHRRALPAERRGSPAIDRFGGVGRLDGGGERVGDVDQAAHRAGDVHAGQGIQAWRRRHLHRERRAGGVDLVGTHAVESVGQRARDGQIDVDVQVEGG